ncbi:uncharacterized protein [Palaemon carinicauda]|uniref:uncharacterized protein n=1 Tax=Palaemon carinicauda TaxID=392227 RepID=UPI0035B66010
MDYGGYESEGKGKRKQHCTYCKNHGKKSRKTNHKCEHEECACLLCKLTRLSRLIMRHQQRLWRHLKDSKRREDAADAGGGGGGAAAAAASYGPSTNGPPDSNGIANGSSSTKQQKCDMCRNHGKITSKRAHKNACPYQSCTCALCNLTRKRRDIMRHQQRVRRSQVTSKQHNEAWEYVIQATAELEFLSFKQTQPLDDQTATSSSASPSPSPDPSSNSASLSLKLEVISSNPVTPPTTVVTTGTSSKMAPTPSPGNKKMPPLELLPDCSPRYSPRPSAPPPSVPVHTAAPRTSEPLTPQNPVPASISVKDIPMMESELAWKNLKREREEVLPWSPKVQTREENLFGHLDFMRGPQTLTGRLEPPVQMEGISFHDTAGAVDFGSPHMSPFKGLMPMMDASRIPPAPLKKTRTDENLHFQYNPMFWGNIPVEPRVGFVPEDIQQQCYRSVLMNNADIRMRTPPGLLPIPQPQHPLRPRPLAPLRPHTIPSSMEWDHVNLHYLACFLQNRGGHYRDTLSTAGPFGLPREPPFLHPPVP